MMWYKNNGKDNDIALNSRVKLVRNVAGYPFTERMTDEQKKELVEKIKAILPESDGWTATDFASATENERLALAEKRIISRHFAASKGVLLLNEEKSAAVMLLGGDHIAIQCTQPGSDVKAAMDAAYEIEGKLDEALEFAFNEQVGYLTHRASEIGTGMKATVTLHLPVYTHRESMRSLSYQLSGFGIGIRSMHGEGERACLYQVSSPAAAGLTEEEAVGKLTEAVGKIIEQERKLRGEIRDERRDMIRERAMRSIGMMLYAGRLRADEILGLYSTLRLAAVLGETDMKPETADEIFFSTLPHTVMAENPDCTSMKEIAAKRAEKIKAILQNR